VLNTYTLILSRHIPLPPSTVCRILSKGNYTLHRGRREEIPQKNKTCSETSGDGYHGNPCCTRSVTADIRRKINNDGDQFYGMLRVHFVPHIAHYMHIYIYIYTYYERAGVEEVSIRATYRTCPRLINNIVSGGYGAMCLSS